MTSVEDFRAFLVRELTRRQARNAAYSLSAFARDLRMSPQKLSQVLSGQSGLSPRAARDLSPDLNLNSNEVDYFHALVDAHHARSPIIRRQAAERVQTFKSIHEAFEMQPELALTLAHWQHWTAYLLVEVVDFQPRLEWISKRLGLDEETCGKIFADLFASGLLRIDERARWVHTNKKISFAAAQSTSTIREFYRQMLGRAAETLESEPVDQRYVRVTMLPLKPSDFEIARKRIEAFAHSVLDELATDTSGAERVYALAVELFPLDKKEVTQ